MKTYNYEARNEDKQNNYLEPHPEDPKYYKQNNYPKPHPEELTAKSTMKIICKPVKCICGSNTKGKGRLIECSSKSCSRCISRKTRNESVIRWNEMNSLEKAVDI
jgi:hypothetical protein